MCLNLTSQDVLQYDFRFSTGSSKENYETLILKKVMNSDLNYK